MSFLFWGSICLLAHTYFFYPITLLGWDRIRQIMHTNRGSRLKHSFAHTNNQRQPEGAEGGLPKVTLIIPAHNEEKCIKQKLSNSLSLQYPPHLLEIIVGSDGSTDTTDSLVDSFSDRRITLSRGIRAGKSAVLNRCITMAKGEIIVLTDANTIFDCRAIQELVGHFTNPQVGAVCGRLKLFNRSNPDFEESTYWSYETFLKYYEGKSGSVIGANGGIYAIRRTLYQPITNDTIVDDFTIPMRILLCGFQVKFEPNAVAYEETTENYGDEFSRKARISAGNFQAFFRMPELLCFWKFPFMTYAFCSHKLLRWFAPFFMASTLVSNVFLLHHPGIVYPLLLACQILFYALASLKKTTQLGKKTHKIASAAFYFVCMNAALAAGFWRFIRNRQSALWERSPR